MVSIVYRKKFLEINQVWFCEDIDDVIKNCKADILYVRGNKSSARNALIKPQLTMITDLVLPLDEIAQNIHKRYRREMRQAEKEGIQCIAYSASDLLDDKALLTEFQKEYEEFARLKGVSLPYNALAVNEYVKSGHAVLTRAFHEGVNYAQHLYVCDDKNVRGLYSASNFRTEGLDASMTGRANKLLHWFEMEHFQQQKIEIMDWGGITSFENPNGIDNFKLGFGGRRDSYNNIVKGISPVGKLAVFFMRFRRSE